MAFLGSHPRCKGCEKRVFFTEQFKTTEGDTFHRACFRCKQCQKPLEINDYACSEGVLYCKPHFEQRSSKAPPSTASLPPVTPTKPPPVTPTKPPMQRLQNELLQKTPSKGSFRFLGTQEKCVACLKTVYPLEKVSVEGASYHKACFKCLQGGCSITPSNYAAMEGRLYCKHHFKQLFKEKGNYSQLLVKLPSAKIPPTEAR